MPLTFFLFPLPVQNFDPDFQVPILLKESKGYIFEVIKLIVEVPKGVFYAFGFYPVVEVADQFVGLHFHVCYFILDYSKELLLVLGQTLGDVLVYGFDYLVYFIHCLLYCLLRLLQGWPFLLE